MGSSNMIRALGIGTLLALALGMAGTADARSGGTARQVESPDRTRRRIAPIAEAEMLNAIRMTMGWTAFGAVVVGQVWLVILAFRTGLLWGLTCLFVTPATVVFAVLHWRAGRDAFLLQITGLLCMFVLVSLK